MMEESKGTTPTSVAPTLVVATAQGLLLWWLPHTNDLGTWPGSNREWYLPLLAFGILIGPLIYAFAPWQKRVLTWGIIATLATLLLASGWEFSTHAWAPGSLVWRSESIPFPLFLLQVLVLFHLVPFIQSYLMAGHWSVDYRHLFLQTWQNALRLSLAAFFTGILMLLLCLCAELFKMIGLPVVSILLFSVPGFIWLFVALAFGVGFYLVGSSERLLIALRQQVLTLLKWLVPVAILIVVAFSVALAFRTPVLLAEHRHVIRAVWLLWLVIVSVYLYNAAYQDGGVSDPYPALLGRMLRWTTPLLLLLAAMAAYSLWLRIDEYGVTTARYWGVVVAVISIIYTLGYTVAAFRPVPWMGAMGRANIIAAVVVIVVLALALTAQLAPTRLSARSQAARLAHSNGIADAADFMALRFDAGAYGYAELEKLAVGINTPDGIRNGARAALQVKEWQDRAEFKYTTVPPPNVFLEAFPAGAQIDAELRALILKELPFNIRQAVVGIDPIQSSMGELPMQNALERSYPRSCSAESVCPVLFVDLDGDDQAEVVAFLPNFSVVYQKSNNVWTLVGKAYMQWRRRTNGNLSAPDLLRELKAGHYQVSQPHWKTLSIANTPLHLDLPEDTIKTTVIK